MAQNDLGRPNIFPLLRYEDAPAALQWLATAFGFEQQLVIPGPGGRIEHAELRLARATSCSGPSSGDGVTASG